MVARATLNKYEYKTLKKNYQVVLNMVEKTESDLMHGYNRGLTGEYRRDFLDILKLDLNLATNLLLSAKIIKS